MAKSSVIFDAYYLISSESPSVEDLTGCLLTIEYNDGEKDIITLTSDNITQPASNVIDVADGMVVVTSAENITYGSNTFPSIGTYFRRRENKRASSIFKGTLEKLNSKFIDTDSLPKETLKITVTLDTAISTVNSLIYHSDKTSDNIKICLDHGGIPYVEFHFYTTDSAAANDYELLTYSGYSNTLGYMFTNAENGNLLCINGHTVSIYSSTAKTELDSAVKTTEQTLTDEEKAQARTNIGAGTQYTLPEASSSELGGVKADDATETDTQVVRKGADGKLYTAAAVPQVQSDYDQNNSEQAGYIKNRPFYEDSSVNITWDGDTTGKTSISAWEFIYLISSETPSVEDLTGATLSKYVDDGTEQSIVLTAEDVIQSDNVIAISEIVFIALEDNATYNTYVFPTKGTYFLKSGNAYPYSIFKGTLKKIDPKFIDMNSLPKETVKITVTYDSSTESYSSDKDFNELQSLMKNNKIQYYMYIVLYGVTASGHSVFGYCGYDYDIGYMFVDPNTGDMISISQYNGVSMYTSNIKGELSNTVKTIEQELTDEQKTQARENIEACDRTHRYELISGMSNIYNTINLLDTSSEYSTIGSIIQLKSIAKILMKSLIYTLIYGHAETYDSILSVNTYDNNLNSDATYEYSTSDTGYSTVSAIDSDNYKCTLNIRNVDCFEVYFIANTSTLTEEYSSSFSATGVYLKYLATPSYASQYLRIKFKVLQYYKLSDHYLDSTVERTKNKVTAISDSVTDDQYPSALSVKTELDKTVKTTEQTLTDEQKAQARTNIGAGGPQVQSDYTQNNSTQADYIKNRPFYEYTAVDITWDGDTAGKTEVDLTSALGFNVYLVSDATPSVEDLTGSTLTIYDGSSSMELSVSARALSENVIIGSDGYVFVVLADNSEVSGITFPSKGTYLVSAGGSYVSRITKKAINKIDPKFIPNGIDTLKVTVTYNSSTDTYSADKTSDDIKTCLDNGGIPYVYYNKDVYTYVGSWETGYSFRRWTGGYIFISSSSVSVLEEDLYEYTNRKVTAIDNTATDEQYPSALAVKTELDKTIKITEQTLTDEQKSQARTNIGATDISLGLTGASAGQIIRIKSVDESGMPTEWEAADSYHAILKTWTAADLEETT